MVKDIKITLLYKTNGCIHVTAKTDDRELVNEESTPLADFVYISAWVVGALRPVLLSLPVRGEVDVDYQIIEVDNCPNIWKKTLTEIEASVKMNCDKLWHVIINTNAFLTAHQQYQGVGKQADGVLFYTMDDNRRVKSFYEYHSSRYTVPAYYVSYASGWDIDAAAWQGKLGMMPPQEFFQYCRANHIGKVVSGNYFMEVEYLNKYDIYLSAIWNFMGMIYVGLDIDGNEMMPFDGFRFFHVNDGSYWRFSPTPSFVEMWRAKANAQNVHYHTVLQHYEHNEPEIKPLPDDYQIAVLSLSRITQVCQHLALILKLLDGLKSDLSIAEHQLWYLAIRQLIWESQELRDDQKKDYTFKVWFLSYQVSQFLKYESVHALNTERTVKIYGDKGWGVLFPDYYQGFLNPAEMKEVYQRGETLYVTCNNNFNYLENGGPIFDMVANNLPFLTWGPLARTEQFAGFRHMEYNDEFELNYRVRNAQALFQEADVKTNYQLVQNIHHDSETRMAEMIFAKPREAVIASGNSGLYWETWCQHDPLLKARTQEYLDENKDALIFQFREILTGGKVYDFRQSRYWQRPYFQRLMEHYRDR